MFRAELPSSVSTEYHPTKFGAGTQRHTRGNHVIYEVYADRRKAGTSLRSRILHVKDIGPDASQTTLVLSPGTEYQNIEIKREGETVTRTIGVNGTHIKMEVVDHATQEIIESVRLGFNGDIFEEVEPSPTEHILEPNIASDIMTTPTLPTKIATELVDLLTSVGKVIRNPQQHLPIEHVVALSNIFVPTNTNPVPTQQVF